jgi:hypothetical protein
VGKILLTGGMPLSQAYPIINSNMDEIYAALGIGVGLDLSELGDVLIASPVEKQFLQWDPTAAGGAGRWVNSAVSINEINGVDITVNPLDEFQVLQYDGSKWINSKVTMAELNDVTISGTPATFQVIQWNGSAWVNSAVNVEELGNYTQTGVSPTTFQTIQWDGTKWTNSAVNVAELGDVIVTGTPVSGQTIKWTGSNWANSKVGVGELNNVSLGTMGAGQAGQTLQWNGANWTNSKINYNEITNSYVADTGIAGQVIKYSPNAGGSGIAGYVNSTLTVNELGDVSITAPPNDDDILVYDSTTSQWKNQQVGTLSNSQITNLQSAVNRQIISSIMGVL